MNQGGSPLKTCPILSKEPRPALTNLFDVEKQIQMNCTVEVYELGQKLDTESRFKSEPIALQKWESRSESAYVVIYRIPF